MTNILIHSFSFHYQHLMYVIYFAMYPIESHKFCHSDIKFAPWTILKHLSFEVSFSKLQMVLLNILFHLWLSVIEYFLKREGTICDILGNIVSANSYHLPQIFLAQYPQLLLAPGSRNLFKFKFWLWGIYHDKTPLFTLYHLPCFLTVGLLEWDTAGM